MVNQNKGESKSWLLALVFRTILADSEDPVIPSIGFFPVSKPNRFAVRSPLTPCSLKRSQEERNKNAPKTNWCPPKKTMLPSTHVRPTERLSPPGASVRASITVAPKPSWAKAQRMEALYCVKSVS